MQPVDQFHRPVRGTYVPGKGWVYETVPPKTNTSHAAESGHTAGLEVLSGALTAEAAGDRWLAVADKSHASGVDWLRAFDLTGAVR